MTREEYAEIYLKKNEEIRRINHELFIMKREYIEEHKQIKQTPSKIHYIHSYIGWMKQPVIDEKDGYIVGYDIRDGSNSQKFNNKVFPVINEVKKAEASGHSKKNAEQKAAYEVLKIIRQEMK